VAALCLCWGFEGVPWLVEGACWVVEEVSWDMKQPLLRGDPDGGGKIVGQGMAGDAAGALGPESAPCTVLLSRPSCTWAAADVGNCGAFLCVLERDAAALGDTEPVLQAKGSVFAEFC
jgi:hypothetical protein